MAERKEGRMQWIETDGRKAMTAEVRGYWGVIPLPGAPVEHGDKLLQHVVERGRASGALAAGDRIVMVFGTGIRSSQHNMIVVHQID